MKKAICMIVFMALLMSVLMLVFSIAPSFSTGKLKQQYTNVTSEAERIIPKPPAIEWNKTYDSGEREYVESLVQTSDGGYAMAGVICVLGTEPVAAWLVKTDASGNMQWNKIYEATDFWTRFGSLVRTSDGGYAIAGAIQSKSTEYICAWLVKTDASGNMQWNKIYNVTGFMTQFWSLVQTSDGGYAIAGYRKPPDLGGDYDFWLVKTNASGGVQWSRTYGGAEDDLAWSLVQTSDGGYAIAGYTCSFGAGGADFWLVKTDAYGNMQWSRTYGGAEDDLAYCVIQTSDGGYAMAGLHLFVKTDSNGNMQWNMTADHDQYFCVVQTSDGGYAVTGTNPPLLRTDSNGNGKWGLDLEGCPWRVIQTSDGGYAIAGHKPNPKDDFWLAKVAHETYYTLTITTTSGGTTDPAPGTYTYTNGTSFIVSAFPEADYVFDHWELDGNNISSSETIILTLDADHTLKAYFTYSPPPAYDVTIRAHCNTEGVDVAVSITMDSNPTGYTTPHTFTGLTGTHTFTVPDTDLAGHSFKQWSTGETSTTITVTEGGTYTAYYEAPPLGVGGYVIPVDKFALLAPYIGLASTILIATVATIIYIKRFKKREQNNGQQTSIP